MAFLIHVVCFPIMLIVISFCRWSNGLLHLERGWADGSSLLLQTFSNWTQQVEEYLFTIAILGVMHIRGSGADHVPSSTESTVLIFFHPPLLCGVISPHRVMYVICYLDQFMYPKCTAVKIDSSILEKPSIVRGWLHSETSLTYKLGEGDKL